MIYVDLNKGKITLRPMGGRATKFKPDDYAGIGSFITRHWGLNFMCSSSVNHPHEYGFPKTFNVDNVFLKAIDYAQRKVALRIPPKPVKDAAAAIEKAVKAFSRGFPVPIVFTSTNTLIVFKSEDDLMHFLNGLRYGAHLAKS